MSLPRPIRLTRRRILASLAAGAAATAVPRRAAARDWTSIRHGDVIVGLREVAPEDTLEDLRRLLRRAAESCVVDGGGWTIPSPIYGDMYGRDSFWVAMALQSPSLSESIVGQFREDQTRNPDGRAATYLTHAKGPRWKEADRRDDSTIVYVLHSYLLGRMGGTIDRGALGHAYRYLTAQAYDGWYVTRGEWREPSWPTNLDDRGCFHYWADTYRPAGAPRQSPEVFAYNQGLYAVALRALEQMGVEVDRHVAAQAEHAYATMTSPHDNASLPQRAGAAILDVSSLTGEALSLYLFDRSLLGRARVDATLRSFTRVDHADGSFLGYKVIANPDGSHRPDAEFIVPISNPPGYYHNGGSWLLYDGLALYAGARHGLPNTHRLLVDRLLSEIKYGRESHEYLSTSPDQLGKGEPRRVGYGWNSFVLRLIG